jgi:hypothetical protein
MAKTRRCCWDSPAEMNESFKDLVIGAHLSVADLRP